MNDLRGHLGFWSWSSYRVALIRPQVTHDGAQAGDNRAVRRYVLDEIAIRLGDHYVLVQLGSGVVEKLGWSFPTIEYFLLPPREGKGRGITLRIKYGWKEVSSTWPYVKGGSSSLLLLKTAGSGSASHGGNTLPCSFEDRRRMVFSLVGSWRDWRGPLGFGGVTLGVAVLGGARVAGAAGLRRSASATSSWHLRFSRDFSAAVEASLTAFM